MRKEAEIANVMDEACCKTYVFKHQPNTYRGTLSRNRTRKGSRKKNGWNR